MSKEKEIIDVNGVSDEPETEHELATIPETGVQVESMDAIIEVSKKIPEYEKAMNIVMNYILRQSYGGDWVSHARGSEPTHMRAANISGAGAERIAKSLGVRETGWVRKDKTWSDDHKHFTYECEADFSLGSRTVHAFGRATSQDKFFGFANGQWKEISDVKEDDIKMAAFRNCRKEGVRTLLGLRRVPLMKLKELGFNLDLVQYVNFRSSKEAVGQPEAQTQSTQQATQTTEQKQESSTRGILFESAEPGTSKNGKPFYRLTDSEGVKYIAWGDNKSETVSRILLAYRDKQPVNCVVESDGKFNTVKEVKTNG